MEFSLVLSLLLVAVAAVMILAIAVDVAIQTIVPVTEVDAQAVAVATIAIIVRDAITAAAKLPLAILAATVVINMLMVVNDLAIVIAPITAGVTTIALANVNFAKHLAT